MKTVEEAVREQQEAIRCLIASGDKRTIVITDNICAIDFKKYAVKDVWKDGEEGREFEIVFSDAKNVEVELNDFIKYHFQYTDTALEIEYEFKDSIAELRYAQSDAMQKLIESFYKKDKEC